MWGEWAPASSDHGPANRTVTFDDGLNMTRVGKHAAGRKLDGRTWEERP